MEDLPTDRERKANVKTFRYATGSIGIDGETEQDVDIRLSKAKGALKMLSCGGCSRIPGLNKCQFSPYLRYLEANEEYNRRNSCY